MRWGGAFFKKKKNPLGRKIKKVKNPSGMYVESQDNSGVAKLSFLNPPAAALVTRLQQI